MHAVLVEWPNEVAPALVVQPGAWPTETEVSADMAYGTCIDCDLPAVARGCCFNCYGKRKYHGTLPPLIVVPEDERHRSDATRFLSKVDVNGPTMPHMDTNCHVWTAGVDRQGYGKFTWSRNAKKTHIKASRWGWLTFVGPIPDETPYVLHHCDNPPCVRLSHLYLGTHRDNTNDVVARDRQHKGERNGSAKLTELQVIEMRKRRADGESRRDLACDYGVTKEAVWSITTGRSWKHLPLEES